MHGKFPLVSTSFANLTSNESLEAVPIATDYEKLIPIHYFCFPIISTRGYDEKFPSANRQLRPRGTTDSGPESSVQRSGKRNFDRRLAPTIVWPGLLVALGGLRRYFSEPMSVTDFANARMSQTGERNAAIGAGALGPNETGDRNTAMVTLRSVAVKQAVAPVIASENQSAM
jgi:hypothetical protein